MLLQPFRFEELHFAWCNRIYFRARTHRRISNNSLASLQVSTLAVLLQPYNIHVLEFASSDHEMRGLLSLQPNEAASTAVSKTKGRISKWLAEQVNCSRDHQRLARGYFAITIGQPNATAVSQYLEIQPHHHGYVDRARPPVLVRSISHSDEEIRKLQTDHASTRLRYHLVLAVPKRHGVFHTESADHVVNRWLELQEGFLIDKVSFLPDHVHISASVHPTVSPAHLAFQLMNSSQDFMWKQYPDCVVKAGVDRLWESSAYLGSFGDLSSNAVAAYMKRWDSG